MANHVVEMLCIPTEIEKYDQKYGDLASGVDQKEP
jgi:hypothetical protein